MLAHARLSLNGQFWRVAQAPPNLGTGEPTFLSLGQSRQLGSALKNAPGSTDGVRAEESPSPKVGWHLQMIPILWRTMLLGQNPARVRSAWRQEFTSDFPESWPDGPNSFTETNLRITSMV